MIQCDSDNTCAGLSVIHELVARVALASVGLLGVDAGVGATVVFGPQALVSAAVEGLVAGVGAVRTLVTNLLVGDALLRVVLAHPLSLGAGGGRAPNLRVISKS